MPLSAARLSQLIQKIYPRELAGAWDNTGLLLESSFTLRPKVVGSATKILLCIDLTTKVCDEALDTDGCAHIITYHPVIFSGLKSITLQNSQQRSLLRLAAAGISVYSPHTAVDAVWGGVNDMLVDMFRKTQTVVTNQVVEPCQNVPHRSQKGEGMGRIMQFEEEVTLEHIVQVVKSELKLDYIRLAKAHVPRNTSGNVKSIGLCAGSGGSVLAKTKVDLILTGELSHHELLAFLEKGIHVILCGHSNTERPFLPMMKDQLDKLMSENPDEDSVEIVVSSEDVCPFQTL